MSGRGVPARPCGPCWGPSLVSTRLLACLSFHAPVKGSAPSVVPPRGRWAISVLTRRGLGLCLCFPPPTSQAAAPALVLGSSSQNKFRSGLREA